MKCKCGELRPAVFETDTEDPLVIIRHRIGYAMIEGKLVPKYCDGVER